MADLRDQLRALQNDPNLGQFIMRDARPTGRQLGIGSYGSVEEVTILHNDLSCSSYQLFVKLQIKVGGLVCAGKTIHVALLDGENIGADSEHCTEVCSRVPADGRSSSPQCYPISWVLLPTTSGVAHASDGET